MEREGGERERGKKKKEEIKNIAGDIALGIDSLSPYVFFSLSIISFIFSSSIVSSIISHIYTHTHTPPFILSLSPNRIIKIHAKEKFILFFLHSLSVLQPFPSPWLFVTRPVTYYTVHLGWGRRVFEGGQDKRRGGGGGKAVVAWRGRGPSTVILFQVSVPSVDGRPATCGITA